MPIDYSKYPPNWKTEIVPRILDRARNKCEVCGLENRDVVYSFKLAIRDDNGRYKFKAVWVPDFASVIRMKNTMQNGAWGVVRVVLTVAHLDHDETNWDVKDDRLRAMCQHCHLNYDSVEKMRRIMSKENA